MLYIATEREVTFKQKGKDPSNGNKSGLQITSSVKVSFDISMAWSSSCALALRRPVCSEEDGSEGRTEGRKGLRRWSWTLMKEFRTFEFLVIEPLDRTGKRNDLPVF